MKKHCFFAFALGFIIFLLSTPAWAIWVSANSYVYFDAQGNVIGQSITECSVSIRRYEGTTSVYWREDSLNCDRSTISGWACTWPPNNQLEDTIYPDGNWFCDPVVTYKGPGTLQTSEQYLPPGMTLEESCEKAQCDRPDEFLGQWTTSPQNDPSNISLPPQLR